MQEVLVIDVNTNAITDVLRALESKLNQGVKVVDSKYIRSKEKIIYILNQPKIIQNLQIPNVKVDPIT